MGRSGYLGMARHYFRSYRGVQVTSGVVRSGMASLTQARLSPKGLGSGKAESAPLGSSEAERVVLGVSCARTHSLGVGRGGSAPLGSGEANFPSRGQLRLFRDP
jgi:hypothetical protein